MKKLVAESISEFRNSSINEGIFDSLKTKINKFLEDPDSDIAANKLISTAFARQFSSNPNTKAAILKLPLEKKRLKY